MLKNGSRPQCVARAWVTPPSRTSPCWTCSCSGLTARPPARSQPASRGIQIKATTTKVILKLQPARVATTVVAVILILSLKRLASRLLLQHLLVPSLLCNYTQYTLWRVHMCMFHSMLNQLLLKNQQSRTVKCQQEMNHSVVL